MKYLILVALFAFATSQEEEGRRYPIFNRTCTERSALIRHEVKTAFSVAAYSGTWFEVGRYQQQDEPEADCLSSGYAWGFISRSFTISRIGYDFATNETFTRQAIGLLSFPNQTPVLGLLNITYYADREADEVNYYVLATDYFQYAIGWACENLDGGQSREFAWVLSRTPELPEAYDERVTSYIDRFFDRELIRDTSQNATLCAGN